MYQAMETTQPIQKEMDVGPNGNRIKIKLPKVGNAKETIDKIIGSEKIESSIKDTIEANQTKFTPVDHLGDYDEEPFTIIESYFKDKHLNRLVRHQLESYNHFINDQIIRTIDMFNPVQIHSENDYVTEKDAYTLELFLSFNNFKLHPPQIHENNGATKLMFPQEAKLRNFTYASTMTVDMEIKYVIRDTENMDNPKTVVKILPKINIGKMPIMLKSSICVLTQNKQIHPKYTGECSMDSGGYFIIKGSEKVVLGQERAAENKIYCFDGKNTTKWSYYAEIKSVPDMKCISPKQIEMMIATKNIGFGNAIYMTIPRIKQPIELFTVFRALGVMTDKEICKYIVLDIDDDKNEVMLNLLKASIIDGGKYMTQEESIRHISAYAAYTPINMEREQGLSKKKEFTTDVLNNDIFPHCKTKEQKIYLIGYMANQLIQTSLGFRKVDDRDSYANKRIELTGALLNNLFRNYFNKLVKEMQKHVIREINNGSWRSTEDYSNIINMTNIYKIMKSTTIENGITRALSTGDFSIKQTNSSKVGVAQVLSRLTYTSSISHIRRISTPLEKSGELVAPRKLHPTCWGFICLVETPEGQSIGIVKTPTYLGHITIPTNNAPLYDYTKDHIIPIEELKQSELFGKVKVFINGSWIGIARDPENCYRELKDKKYKGIINIYTSIIFDRDNLEIKLCSDGGRMSRPVLRVKDNKVIMTSENIEDIDKNKLKWNDLLTSIKLKDSVIEYIDPDEQGFALIAMKDKSHCDPRNNYTHCEIHPSIIFGVLASCTPFPDHNQAPRNTYQCAMAKQALGIYALNFDKRMDKTAYVLTYPSRPLVDTRLMNYLHLNKCPGGSQVSIAIMCYGGYNMEDSVLINEGAIKRGLFSATIYHTEKDDDKNVIRDEIIRCKPDPTKTKGVKFGNYDKLNKDGFIPENTLVENRDIIISKIVPIKENRNDPTKTIKYEDQSKVYTTSEDTYVDKNFTGRNGDGYDFAKTRTRTHRVPVYGDKVSSRHGQKGTIGNIVPECDMPFTKDGTRPDIIINPHAIPSRMTIGQLKETILGKVLLELGLFGDGTSFGNLDVATISNKLQELGMESYGNEILYNGLNGEQLETEIFIGPVFYQRLKHMVNDKVHSRATGPMVNLTRQPAEGRSRSGGLRIGEMERDVLLSHGGAAFCKDRLYEASDKYVVNVCKKCGMIAAFNDGKSNNFHTSSDFKVHLCNTCGNRTDFARVDMPYANKLMFQELQTMNVIPRVIVE